MKKFIKYTLALILLVVVGYGINYFYDLSYDGNKKEVLLSGKNFNSLEEILNYPAFDNKVVFVDLWGVYCSPCIKQFAYVPALKKEFKNKPVEYLYLSSPYGYFNDEQQWKDALKEYKLKGYHYLLSIDLYYKIWKTIEENPKERHLIPRYLIIDQDGYIFDPQAPYPSSKDSLYQEIRKALAQA